jgi:hypothetical protein
VIAQRCPKCGSSRLRRGYTDTPLLLRMIGVYRFLCDNCNLLFIGFAVPGTVPARGSRRRRHRAERAARAGGSAGRRES